MYKRQTQVIPLRDVVVGPDEKRCLIGLLDLLRVPLIQLFAVKGLKEGISQRRLMVPEEDDHGLLLHLGIVLHQGLDGLVTLLHQGEVLGLSLIHI